MCPELDIFRSRFCIEESEYYVLLTFPCMMSLIVRVTLGLDWAVSGLVWSRVAMVCLGGGDPGCGERG